MSRQCSQGFPKLVGPSSATEDAEKRAKPPKMDTMAPAEVDQYVAAMNQVMNSSFFGGPLEAKGSDTYLHICIYYLYRYLYTHVYTYVLIHCYLFAYDTYIKLYVCNLYYVTYIYIERERESERPESAPRDPSQQQ